MPHTAFRLLEVVDKFPLRIESLAVWGNKLLVGTAEGVLLVMGPEGNSGKERYNVLDSKKAFAKKTITMKTVVKPGPPNKLKKMSFRGLEGGG